MGLINALLAEGYRVTALAPQDEFSDRLVAAGCAFCPLPMDNKGTSPLKDYQLYLGYKQAFAQLKPDVFLGYTVKPNIYGTLAAQALEIPTINNVSGLGTVFIRKSLITSVVTRLYRRAFRHSDKVFFQNTDDRALFLKNQIVVGEKTGLLPGSGIDLQQFAPRKNSRLWDPENPIFLMVARLVRDKGVHEFVEAAKIVKRHNPRARFQLLGFLDVENRTAVAREDVAHWVAQGWVEYLGATDDVRPWIESADCVVLPSYREGTPRTLLEAAAMARPLITTDVPGCREVVTHERNGFLCQPKDPDDLAQQMLKLCRLDADAFATMGQESRNIAREKFDESLVIAPYLQVIDSLVNAGKSK